MKLCDKCQEDIVKLGAPSEFMEKWEEPVPELKCQFWAHRALNDEKVVHHGNLLLNDGSILRHQKSIIEEIKNA